MPRGSRSHARRKASVSFKGMGASGAGQLSTVTALAGQDVQNVGKDATS
jgi:hypothetical protein